MGLPVVDALLLLLVEEVPRLRHPVWQIALFLPYDALNPVGMNEIVCVCARAREY